MTKQKTPQRQYALPKWFLTTCIVILATTLMSAGYFFYWQTGWPGYLTALKECDNKPPVQASSFIASKYINPGDEHYRIPGENGYRTYFCTEPDAKSAGYTHRVN